MATNLHENLQKGGASLHVHNRTESKAKSLIDKGATWENSPAEIAKKCRITFSSMFADAGLKSTFQAWLSGKPQKGSIYVDSSTVYPGTAKELTTEAEKAGKALAFQVANNTLYIPDCSAAMPSACLCKTWSSLLTPCQSAAYCICHRQLHLLSCIIPQLLVPLSFKSLRKQRKYTGPV